MPKQIEVYGKLQRIDGPLRLIPDSGNHPELQEAYISCPKHVGGEKATEGWTATFLVEEIEGTVGAASHRVIGVVASAGKRRSESPPRNNLPHSVDTTQSTRSARPQPSHTHPTGQQTIGGDGQARFIHPYNFVRMPSVKTLAEAIKDNELFKRGPSAPHDVYDRKLNSGFIDCELTTHTHWFIPDARKKHKPNDHATVGYFTLDDVPKDSWNHAAASADNTAPAIPGSSLRGMIRSVFEAITLSCFSVFDSERLDFRIGYSPDHHHDETEFDVRYVPCRVVERTEDEMTIQLLEGRTESFRDKPTVINSALVRAYENKVRSGDGPHPQWSALGDAVDGTPVIGFLNQRLTSDKSRRYRWRALEHPMALMNRDEYVEFAQRSQQEDFVKPLETFVQSILDWLEKHGHESAERHLVFGFLHRTGPNWHDKKDERVFYDASALYNRDPSNDLIERLRLFLIDKGECISVSKTVTRECTSRMREYSHRNGKKVKREFEAPPRKILRKEALPSDFILKSERNVTIRVGDLFYALIREDADAKKTVQGLYPVAIPRLSHEESRGNLLHNALYPCSRKHEKCARCSNLEVLPKDERNLCNECMKSCDYLCPACRVFGWTRDLSFFRREDRESLKTNANRVDARAGHVRFTHGTLVGNWESRRDKVEIISLRILGSPHPTATGFYLQPLENWEEYRTTRWPPVTGLLNSRNPVANLPAYRHEEAQLRGRKLYRRREQVSRSSLENPNHPPQNNQNQTIHSLPASLTFQFRVHFDNLSEVELGALLFSLELNVPDNWTQTKNTEPGNAKFHHALGHGKPLGMGRCSIKATGIVREGVDRYTADQFTTIVRSSTSRGVVESDRRAFVDAWKNLENNHELIQLRTDLLDMLNPIPRGESIDYPPVNVVGGSADFNWWKVAKTSGALLPFPTDERIEQRDRLPKDELQLEDYANRERNDKV